MKLLERLSQLLPEPSAQQVRAARDSAGHTQVQAAATIGIGRWQTWSEYEGGKCAMPALSWTFYLLATGQHPVAALRKAPK